MPRCVRCGRIQSTAELSKAQQPKGEWTCKSVDACARVRELATAFMKAAR